MARRQETNTTVASHIKCPLVDEVTPTHYPSRRLHTPALFVAVNNGDKFTGERHPGHCPQNFSRRYPGSCCMPFSPTLEKSCDLLFKARHLISGSLSVEFIWVLSPLLVFFHSQHSARKLVQGSTYRLDALLITRIVATVGAVPTISHEEDNDTTT